MGEISNTLIGALGGAIGGRILFAFLGLSGTVQAASALVTGGIAGGLTTLVGWVSKVKGVDLKEPSMIDMGTPS